MKELINKIIQDLGEDKPIKTLLLKAQIIASKLNNKEFEEWIHNEQNGYPRAENIPKYRRLNATVKADISIPFHGIYKNYTIPNGIFSEQFINDYMYHVDIVQSLSEIESLSDNKGGGMLSVGCPAIAYNEVSKYVRGNVERVWQEISSASLAGVLDAFKSKLLSFFLDLDKKVDAGIDFSKIEGQKEINQIMNTYNINAVVANTGNGTVSTGNISENNPAFCISDAEQQRVIQSLVDQLIIESKKINNKDLQIAVEAITEECKKSSWGKNALKLALNAVQGVATSVVANQLTPITTQLLALIK